VDTQFDVPSGEAGTWARVGAWAFRQRSWLPVPLALILVFVRVGEYEAEWPMLIGVILVACGLALRFWAVRHIGDVSRTRTNRSGALQVTGPYALVRNPLYVANWLLWTGFTMDSELDWMLVVAWGIFALQYSAIVAWEERLMHERFGSEYDAYVASTPRWIPSWRSIRTLSSSPAYTWRRVFFSERGTLIAAGCMLTLLALKEVLN
jgi:protein-S-isoprenylcysteine O-methyltransferase Ste14